MGRKGKSKVPRPSDKSDSTPATSNLQKLHDEVVALKLALSQEREEKNYPLHSDGKTKGKSSTRHPPKNSSTSYTTNDNAPSTSQETRITRSKRQRSEEAVKPTKRSKPDSSSDSDNSSASNFTNKSQHSHDSRHKRRSKKRHYSPPEQHSDSRSEPETDIEPDPRIQDDRSDVTSHRSRSSHRQGRHDTDFSSSSNSDVEDRPVISFGAVVGEHVSHKIRRKILSNKFIEMAHLLPQVHTSSNNEYILKCGQGNSATFVKSKPKKDLNIQQWSEAFDIFIAVYTKKYRSASSIQRTVAALLSYRKHINDMQKAAYDWAGYDRHFRMERQYKRCSWSCIRHDLYMQYSMNRHSFRAPQQSTRFPKTSKAQQLRTKDGTQIPLGFCVAFHSWNTHCEAGNSCAYQHKCPRCQARHPIYLPCNSNPSKNNKPQQSTNSTPQATSKPQNTRVPQTSR